ncbi:transporter substrate-binding domain-containing protein [Agaribacterium sp. ZY112]|uniref:transporter substrate-binding domain-containing protein n=1 Tax=Agaribacterium sp. ZY112 TaxID=3233574 RepID=UPI0035261B44
MPKPIALYDKAILSPLFFCFVLCALLLLTACSKDVEEPVVELSPSPSPSPEYISSADLDVIKQHGRIRFIAPLAATEPQALSNRSPLFKEYEALANALADRLKLEAEWVFVKDRSDLIPALLAGRGDIIVSNISVTPERKKQVSFSRPLAKVDELVVEHQETTEPPAQKHYIVGEASAFSESLSKQGVEHVTILPADKSAYEWLSYIAEEPSRATVLDSNMARDLIGLFPNLKLGQTLQKRRSIAWALRPDNPKLLSYLNHYLVEHHVLASASNNQPRTWQQIKDSGQLRMLTLNNPSCYFLWRGEQMGFDYDLLNKFAKNQKLSLSVIVKPDYESLIEALKAGEGDVIAASMTATPEREALGVQFSRPYLYIDELIVGALDKQAIMDLSALAGKRVAVNPTTVFYKRMLELQKQGVELELVSLPEASTEELLEALDSDAYDYTLADSHLVALENSYHKHVNEVYKLNEDVAIAWGLRPEQLELKQELDSFIKKKHRGLFYNVTYNKYFKNEKRIKKYQQARVLPGGGLSPYDETVQALAQRYHMDWRLITAQMYQESKFNPKARSHAGAKGLMQVLPRTAKELGFTNLAEPSEGLEAGVAYMHWLKDRFPEDLAFEERLYFTLASYNAGASHVRDARKLARELGYDDKRWFGNVENAMLALSKPKYYKKARFGYVRGREPVNYVRDIRERYMAYLNAM